MMIVIDTNKNVSDNLKKIEIFQKEGFNASTKIHSDVIILLSKKYDEDRPDRVDCAAERLIGYLKLVASVSGMNNHQGVTAFNLVYSRRVDGKKHEITSALSVDISRKSILVSPNGACNLIDLVHLFCGIDRYFEFEYAGS